MLFLIASLETGCQKSVIVSRMIQIKRHQIGTAVGQPRPQGQKQMSAEENYLELGISDLWHKFNVLARLKYLT